MIDIGNLLDQSAIGCFQLAADSMRIILADEDYNTKELNPVDRNIVILKALESIDQCLICVDKEFIFSKNEEVDDVSTSSLKYLFLDYYKGKCYTLLQSLEDRLSNILIAKDSYVSYVQICKDMKILSKDDLNFVDSIDNSNQTAEMKRTLKIEKFKRNRDSKTLIATLLKNLYSKSPIDEDANDREENFRELYIAQLQYYTREAIDEIDLIKQEIVMLRFKEQQKGTKGIDKNSTAPALYCNNKDGPGISVTKTFKVGDKLLFSRETIKVFGSHIAPPTMSLEEFGNQEKIAAESRSNQEVINTDAQTTRRYNQLYEDGEEDDEELVKHATYKDRDWDNWKDDNPRGWGNKMGKRF